MYYVHKARGHLVDLAQNKEQGLASRTLPPVTYAPHTTQLWLKPMTQEYMLASQTSPLVHTLKSKSYPEAKRSRSCSCCEKKESESACVTESLRIIIIVAVYQTIRERQPQDHLKALVRRASTASSTRYTVSSVPQPHAIGFTVVITGFRRVWG